MVIVGGRAIRVYTALPRCRSRKLCSLRSRPIPAAAWRARLHSHAWRTSEQSCSTASRVAGLRPRRRRCRPLVPSEPFCHHASLAPVLARILGDTENRPGRARLPEGSDGGIAEIEDERALTLLRFLTRQGPRPSFEVDLLPAGLARLLRPCRGEDLPAEDTSMLVIAEGDKFAHEGRQVVRMEPSITLAAVAAGVLGQQLAQFGLECSGVRFDPGEIKCRLDEDAELMAIAVAAPPKRGAAARIAIEHGRDVINCDFGDGHIEDRAAIARNEATVALLGTTIALRVIPAAALRPRVALPGLPKRHDGAWSRRGRCPSLG